MAQRDNLVSVVIPSYGRFEALLRCIESVLAAQPLPTGGLELILITSVYAASQLTALRERGCRIVEPATAVPTSASRNVGAAEALGTHLLFLDDDNVVAPDAVWLLW